MIITLQYWDGFLSYINMNWPEVYMCPPILNPLPLHPIPLGWPSALALGALLHASNLHWSSILHMVIYMFQCYSLIPLQCSCLENPRNRGAWWAAVSGVAQSWTRLKRLSSSSSSAVLSNHPTLTFSHRVQKSVLYICSFAVLHTGSSLLSF